jgi:hypothetical protein
MGEFVNETCNTVSRAEKGLRGTRLTSDHCGPSVSKRSNFPTSSMGPHRGGCPARERKPQQRVRADAEADRAREESAQQRGGLAFAERESFLEGGGASSSLRGPISAPVSPRRTSSPPLCESQAETAWLNSGGPILRVALRGMSSHLHTIWDQIRGHLRT